jgi:hypothetical protein
MSLDVYLTIPKEPGLCWCSTCGHKHPGQDYAEVYSAAITHNLTEMAEEAGIYKACWRPDEIGITHAEQLIPLLEKGLAALESNPKHFEAFNPKNGWGSYEGLVRWVRNYLDACRAFPAAKVRVSR